MDWWTQNKDAITAIGAAIAAIITIGGIIWAIFKWGILRWWQNRVRIDVKVFEVITNPSVLLPKLYATENDDSPLADHNIKYQPRDPNRDLQAELKAALNRSRYLLITAPTGYGKTREAGMLAQTMMLEGWRVLRIRTGWLDVPKTLPEELNGNRSRILIFLDDLNGLFSTGNLTQSPRVENEKTLMLSQLSYHDRLLQMLDMLEGMCTESEIRVIATARSEAEQWKILEYNENDGLWKRFERIEIPEPADTVIVNLLEDATKQADLKADETEFEAIAHKSDGTYRNILLNLRRFRSQNKPVSKDDFTDTLDGSWKDIYERAVKKHPAVEYIYEAINVLRQAGIELFPFVIEPTALMIWSGNYFKKFLYEQRVRNALQYLTHETKILRLEKGKLAPSDGQIEARNTTTTWFSYSLGLEKILTEKKRINLLDDSLIGFGLVCYKKGERNQAIRVWQNVPANSRWYLILQAGINLELKKFTQAENSLKKLTDNESTRQLGHIGLGMLFVETKHYDEAEVNYRKAIELDPSDADAYDRLIRLLRFDMTNRSYDAIPLLEKVLEITPEDFNPYLAMASIKKQLGENISKDHIQKTHQFIPKEDWYDRACLESICNNLDLAFEYLQKAGQEDEFDSTWAWKDPDLQWIRDDPRFIEIVGPKPENKNSEN